MSRPVVSPVLPALARLYRESAAGKTGGTTRPFSVGLGKLLAFAHCDEGDAHQFALDSLRAVAGRFVRLVPEHRRDPKSIARIHLAADDEVAFFEFLGESSPQQQRAAWATFFREAAEWVVPARDLAAWRNFCHTRAVRALTWDRMAPLRIPQLRQGRDRLEILRQLLLWDQERAGRRHLVRWVSSLVAKNSKYLEKTQGFFEALLSEATAGRVGRYDGIGIEPMPRKTLIHGPLQLVFPDGRILDVASVRGAVELELGDVERSQLLCSATRCVTVENKTPFLDLVAQASGVLLLHTSYPNAATLELIRRLPATVRFWHLGDSDPQGFDILRDLRVRSGRDFQPLAMKYRSEASSVPMTVHEVQLVSRLLRCPELAALPEVLGELEKLNSVGTKGDFETESLSPAVVIGLLRGLEERQLNAGGAVAAQPPRPPTRIG